LEVGDEVPGVGRALGGVEEPDARSGLSQAGDSAGLFGRAYRPVVIPLGSP
jgi:hypothetical protein